MKAVRLKSSGQSVGRRMIYGGKDLWNRCVLSLEWKRSVIREFDDSVVDRNDEDLYRFLAHQYY